MSKGLLYDLIDDPSKAKDLVAKLEGQDPLATPPAAPEGGTPPAKEEVKERIDDVLKVEAKQPDLAEADPFAPLKQRLGDRPVTDWLSEVDQGLSEKERLAKEREELATKLAEREEKIKFLDITKSEDYQVHVVQPVTRAFELVDGFFGDNTITNEFITTAAAAKTPKERQELIKKYAQEYDVSQRDLTLSLRDYQDAIAKGKGFIANFREYQQKKQQDEVIQKEQEVTALRESQRRAVSQMAEKAAAKLQDELPPLLRADLSKHAHEWMQSFEKGQREGAAGINMEKEMEYNLIGRAYMAKAAELEELFANLEKLEKAARGKVTPATSTSNKGTTNVGVGLTSVLPGIN